MVDDEPEGADPADSGEPRWLSEEEQSAWRAVVTLLMQLPGPLEAQLQRDAGLTLFEYLTLSHLSMAPERTLRMSTLAELADSSLSRLSNVVSRFENRGWVTRRPDPDDARYVVAVLSEHGYAQVVSAAPGHVRAVRRYVIDPITVTQQRSIVAAVSRIRPLLNDRGAT